MTAARYDTLPLDEGRQWGLLDGELIEVPGLTPRQSRIRIRLSTRLEAYVESQSLGAVLPGTDLAVGKDSRLRLDFSFFTAETWRRVDLDRVPVFETPDIAVEIISRSETAGTIQRKVEPICSGGCARSGLFTRKRKPS
jgi:Uma2 family endonuclease